ncbi:MAG TPA: D-aminoacyl-tRNA deacylase [Rectinema sp.]|jgi:D-tyrosyl-tRNA(Tyr) deacylase|nr:D-tyrosyl-tRNA(Tyr) deacylase [Spirochaetia bacterium]MDI9427577.1 D-aminoacyl-tRNA deacylase [Spirochaetota bacterium]NLH90092.1 D-tyrosyl-tRNA(Tyr) deacylase [Treponema sp.]OQC75214.1 MAG: D-tyrosyl-tRNA(Tyr) deacylase [Spirochaetes bacterium ADurb.Bin001]HNP92338.1 D-aminoacyl-tRNA deacylase [Rectinema sp.]
MRAVIQRVSEASVTYRTSREEKFCGSITKGILIYLGIASDDSDDDAEYLADKIAHLRIFMDSNDKMNLSILDLGYEALVISQFTLHADVRKGRRPSYSKAAGSEKALMLFDLFCTKLLENGVHIQTGKFQEIMRIHSINDGPVTILLDSKKAF